MKKKQINTASKGLDYYMSLNYPVTVEEFEENGTLKFGLQIPDLLGVWASGATLMDAYAELNDTKRLWFETCIEKGVEIPEPVSDKDFSGKFILRLDPRLHMALHKAALKNKNSLNQQVRNLLEYQIEYTELLNSIKTLVEKIESMNRNISLMDHRIKSVEQVLSSYYTQTVLTATSGQETAMVSGFMEFAQLGHYPSKAVVGIGTSKIFIGCK